MNQSRLVLLKAYWNREWGGMIAQLGKIKKPSKKQLTFKEQLEQIPNKVTNQILYKYLDKCKCKHAMQFFEWRRSFCNDINEIAEYNTIILERKQMYLKMEKELFKEDDEETKKSSNDNSQSQSRQRSALRGVRSKESKLSVTKLVDKNILALNKTEKPPPLRYIPTVEIMKTLIKLATV